MIRQVSLLIIGTAFTSAANFWLYVIVAASDVTGGFAQLVRSNYIGGIYLFGVAASVGVVAMYAFRCGSAARVLRVYAFLCGWIAIPLATACSMTEYPLGAWLCLFSALCMQVAGLMTAALVEAERAWAVSFLPTLHPITVWGTLMGLPEDLPLKWVWCYTIASIGLCALFVTFGWRPLRQKLEESRQVTSIRVKDVAGRMLLAVSFGAALQIDQVVAGTTRHLDVARFAILQKMYASVVTALSGATIQMVMLRTTKDLLGARGVWIIALSGAAAAGAIIAGGVLLQFQPQFVLNEWDVLVIGLTASLYYWSAFANAWASMHWPRTSGFAVMLAALSYASVWLIEKLLHTTVHAIVPMLVFFLSYATAVTWRAWRAGSE